MNINISIRNKDKALQWYTHLICDTRGVIDRILKIVPSWSCSRVDELEMKTLIADRSRAQLLSFLFKIHHVELAVFLETVGEESI